MPTENNHVGSYRREIVVPASWKGKDIIAHFGSVTSNMYLWVNGRYVGYSEDSKLEAEFDLTPYLKPGQKNLIAFQVFRWCDGTYLELVTPGIAYVHINRITVSVQLPYGGNLQVIPAFVVEAGFQKSVGRESASFTQLNFQVPFKVM